MEFKGTKGFEEGFSEGAKWQAGRMYNGKAPEMLEMLIEIKNQIEDGRNYITKEDIEQLIKQATEI
jgi:hypothetical protein